MANETQHLASPALLCEQTQKPYFEVLKLLAAAGVKPIQTLDLVPYYDWNVASRVLEQAGPTIRGSKR